MQGTRILDEEKELWDPSRMKGGTAENRAMPSCLVISLATPFLSSQVNVTRAVYWYLIYRFGIPENSRKKCGNNLLEIFLVWRKGMGALLPLYSSTLDSLHPLGLRAKMMVNSMVIAHLWEKIHGISGTFCFSFYDTISLTFIILLFYIPRTTAS